MKIELVCEIVRDLLPGYIDGLCTDVTKEAVSEHLAGCAECRILAEKMAADEMCGTASAGDNVIVDSKGDEQLMKKIKRKLNKKTKIIALCSVIMIVLVAAGFNLLFNVPLQEVALEDVKVDVHSYAMADLAAAVNENGAYSMRFGEGDDTEITLSEADAGEADADTEMNGSKIYADDGDAGETVRLTVSDNPNMVLDVTREVIDKCQYVSTVAWSSPYYLQDVRLDSTKSDGSTLYVTDMKTTILGNKAKESSQTVTYMEMRKIDKVVYVHDDGTEQVLWQENNK